MIKEKVAIITGSGQGLGKEFAKRFAEESAKVVVADINFERAKSTVQEIEDSGGKAIAIKTDVSKEDSVKKMAKEAIDCYGSIDILVNAAAIYYDLRLAPPEELTVEEWDRVLRVNLIGSWLACKAVFPYMKKQSKGKIINISSDVAFAGVPGFLHYVSSKGGIIAMTRALAMEWGKYNINVNSVAPGYTMTSASLKKVKEAPDSKDFVLARQCFKRLGQPEDIIGIGVFLASEDSDWITGQNICVDGGQILR
jgi:NAD(P)-dependent dehydrogenase (short-subunit alcohol dehydrogenase family)